jgi:PhnB protein
MQINPYLNFNGNCREAFDHYARVLGGKIEFVQTFGESPMASETPPDKKNHVMHESLRIGDTWIMGSDAPTEQFQPAQGTQIAIHADDAAQADRIFAGLAEGGQVIMPIAETFWAERFGMLVDKFGIPWMVNFDGNKAQ